MKVSDCCAATMTGEMVDTGICPQCREHCDAVDEDREDATQELRAFAMKSARNLAGHLDAMKAQKATLPITFGERKYVVTVERTDIANKSSSVGAEAP